MNRIERLKAAIEGECDGLAISDAHARAILAYVDEAPAQGELTTIATVHIPAGLPLRGAVRLTLNGLDVEPGQTIGEAQAGLSVEAPEIDAATLAALQDESTDWMWCYENPHEAACEIDRLNAALAAGAEHHAALQRIGTALELLPGTNLHTQAVPVILALRAASLEKLKALRHINLIINHNDHAAIYKTLEEWLDDDFGGLYDVTPEDRAEMLRTGECWTLQWYPNTPVGFNAVAAATLERCIELATEDQG